MRNKLPVVVQKTTELPFEAVVKPVGLTTEILATFKNEADAKVYALAEEMIDVLYRVHEEIIDHNSKKPAERKLHQRINNILKQIPA